MRTLVGTSLLLLLLGTASPFAYAQTAPVNHYPRSHDSSIAEKLASLDGELVAVEVRVGDIAPGAYGKTYVRANFPDGKPIWIAPIVDLADSVQAGDIVIVMGHVAAISGPEAHLLNALNPTGYHLLGVCYYNFRTSRGMSFPFKSEPNQCSRWRDGQAIGR